MFRFADQRLGPLGVRPVKLTPPVSGSNVFRNAVRCGWEKEEV
jgi:hypothetical protein